MQYRKGGRRGSRRVAVACALVVGAPLAVGVPALADPGGNGNGSGPESAPGQVKLGPAAATVTATARVKAKAAPAASGKASGAVTAKAAPAARSRTTAASTHATGAVNAKAAPAAQSRSHAAASTAASGRAKGAGKAKAAPAAKSHGPAGKTTLCHATGSATNPYVTITVSNNALPAHMRHQDGRDIAPAPAGGCPGGSAKSPGGGEQQGGQGKMTICHATGSATNPFVLITIALPAVQAHDRHQNDEDIIPAPANGCPGAPTMAVSPPGPGPVTPPGQQPTLPGGALLAPGVAPMVSPGAAVSPEAVSNVAPKGVSNVAPENEVLGVTNRSPVSGKAVAPAARQVAGAESSGAQLPFTGIDLWVVAVAGLALLLAGVAGRRALMHRS